MTRIIFHFMPNSSVPDRNADIDYTNESIAEVKSRSSNETSVELTNGAIVRLDDNENVTYSTRISGFNGIKSEFSRAKRYIAEMISSSTKAYDLALLIKCDSFECEKMNSIESIGDEEFNTTPFYEKLDEETLRVSFGGEKEPVVM